MSQKKMDSHNRWRCKTVAFRLSPEEAAQLDVYVNLSGKTKQDYIAARVLRQEVVVHGNPKVFAALQTQLSSVLDRLQNIDANGIDDDLLDTINFIANIVNGMRGGNVNGIR